MNGLSFSFSMIFRRLHIDIFSDDVNLSIVGSDAYNYFISYISYNYYVI